MKDESHSPMITNSTRCSTSSSMSFWKSVATRTLRSFEELQEFLHLLQTLGGSELQPLFQLADVNSGWNLPEDLAVPGDLRRIRFAHG